MSYLKLLADYGLIEPPRPPRPYVAVPYEATGDNPAYTGAALRDEIDRLAGATEHTRNDTLNKAAFALASLVAANGLDRETVEDELTEAARSVGLSDSEIRATIRSAFNGSDVKVGARQIPEGLAEPEVVETKLNGHTNGAVHSDELTEDEKREIHARKVRIKAYELRVADDAKILWASQRAEAMGQVAPVPESLTDLLSTPDLPARYRLTDLWPVGGRVLLAAQFKAGKTSLLANLLRSLVDGDPFLGSWTPIPVARVTLIDTELDKDMLRRWLRDQGIRNTAAIEVISLRGKVGTFNILDDSARAEWAQRIGSADVVLLDCLRPCLDALGLSEDKEAGRFLVAFDALCTEAGAAEALLVHHMGHSQERSRGDSRLLDWPDVLWKIVRDTDDETGNQVDGGDRYFSAMGRDVSVSEQQLDYTHETRSLMVCGGGRAEKKARGSASEIVEILSDPAHADGLSHRALISQLGAFGIGRNVARMALKQALDDRVIITVSGPRNSHVHILNPSRREDD